MKADLYSVLRLSVPAVQVGIAPPEDRALRGRNLSAGLEPDKRQVGPAPAGICQQKRKIHAPPTQSIHFAQIVSQGSRQFPSNPSNQKTLTDIPKSMSTFSGKVQNGSFFRGDPYRDP